MKRLKLDRMLFENICSEITFREDLVDTLRSSMTGTSIEEMCSLYAIAKYYYRGDGLIVDIGCGPGGSSFALAKGLEANGLGTRADPVLSLDIFDGYCNMIYRQKFKNDMKFDSDIDVFHEVTRSVATYVNPTKVDLTKGFAESLNGKCIEIAHIDAAKSLELWVGICETLRHRMLPGRTVLIFQDFERAKLPFQLYGLRQLLPFGEIFGGSFFGTLYFKLNKEIPQSIWESIVCDTLPLEKKLSFTEQMWDAAIKAIPDIFQKSYDVGELAQASIAYVYYYGGEKKMAKYLYNGLSRSFREAPENIGFQKDFS